MNQKYPKSRRFLFNALTTIVSIVLTIAVFEITSRFVIKDSNWSQGTLFNIELPPLQVLPVNDSYVEGDSRGSIVIDGAAITVGDLWGLRREDNILGYTSKETAVSPNGWWQSNNIGARARVDTDKMVPRGKRRILVFGESFGAGSRIKQEDVWSNQLERLAPDLEIVNLAVDGYGMGQSLLRYRSIRESIDTNAVLFIFVPTADLWRDINTVRRLGQSWTGYPIIPRFVREGNGIKLITPPYYPSRSEYHSRNIPAISNELREHLVKYDPFYIPMLYESPPIVGGSITWKLIASFLGERTRKRIMDEAMDISGDAFQVTRAVLLAARDEAERERGGKFLVAILPTDHDLKDKGTMTNLARMNEILKSSGITTIDLLPGIGKLPLGDVDNGCDGTHYGPKMNAFIAKSFQIALREIEF